MFELTDRVALVTGGGQGMGLGVARALAEQGAAVAINDLHPARAADAAELVSSETGATVVPVAFDVSDGDAVTAGVARVVDQLGPVDILVNNAGVPEGMDLRQFRDMEPDFWRQFVDLNLYGSLHCIRAVLEPMRERRHGRIIQISSGAASSGLRIGVSLYGASKSAIEGFIRHLSQEEARSGITANSLALGLMHNSPMESNDALATIARQVPVGRLGGPADVGAAVAYLASDEAAWMTGQTINLNGGSVTT
jgi:NAD(P)-dependent dehydrogenase (short-subunit alcohol dehydrogenase family)